MWNRVLRLPKEFLSRLCYSTIGLVVLITEHDKAGRDSWKLSLATYERYFAGAAAHSVS